MSLHERLGRFRFELDYGAVLGEAIPKWRLAINTQQELTESDIPGAELPRPAEHCTVAILKRWLACSGAKVPGKREDLIKR